MSIDDVYKNPLMRPTNDEQYEVCVNIFGTKNRQTKFENCLKIFSDYYFGVIFISESNVDNYYLQNLCKKLNCIDSKIMKQYLPNHFDWEYYLNYNKDLTSAGLLSQEQAIEHYLTYGHAETRRICEHFPI
jgi:hypothetical protein